VIGFLGSGLTNMMLSLILVEWTGYARLVRSIILSLKGKEFLEAAMSLGATDQYILRKHLLPNVLPQVLVMATLGFGYAISWRSFSELSWPWVQPPTPEWGSMMNDARPFVRAEPQMMIFPGIAITITVLAFNLLGRRVKGET